MEKVVEKVGEKAAKTVKTSIPLVNASTTEIKEKVRSMYIYDCIYMCVYVLVIVC